MSDRALASSFRDPAGHVFKLRGIFYRQVSVAGREDYDLAKKSGLYRDLHERGQLINHREVALPTGFKATNNLYKLLRPQQLDFIAYPYEWSFTQLKAAALLTLEIQVAALQHGMILKDASAYNIAQVGDKLQLIDSLSFEKYDGKPVWTAYKQFCQHFLAPLALMALVDPRLGLLSRDYIDGVPLDIATKLLPRRKRLSPGLLVHLWLHSAAQRRFAPTKPTQAPHRHPAPSHNNGHARLLAQADSLKRSIEKLELPAKLRTEWGSYYQATNYDDRAARHKRQLVRSYVSTLKPNSVWDLGGNDGRYSQVALQAGAKAVICFDSDPVAVDHGFRGRQTGENLQVLQLDLTNPSPALGWANQERQSLTERVPEANTVMALALIHHLAIGNNLPFAMIAAYCAQLGQNLIIEFVPKEDSQVQRLLSGREDIFDHYNQAEFERSFSKYFRITRQDPVRGSKRTLYLMHQR